MEQRLAGTFMKPNMIYERPCTTIRENLNSELGEVSPSNTYGGK